jgi:hypothetical protein
MWPPRTLPLVSEILLVKSQFLLSGCIIWMLSLECLHQAALNDRPVSTQCNDGHSGTVYPKKIPEYRCKCQRTPLRCENYLWHSICQHSN